MNRRDQTRSWISGVRSGTLLALREVRRGTVRFGLLTAAVGFLSFLIVFQQALLGQLVEEFVGALRKQSADVLVYAAEARANPQLSVLDPRSIERVAAVGGVSAVGPLGVATLTVEAAGELTDATLIGYDLRAPGAPRTLSAGRLPNGPGEAVASEGDDPGFGLGAQVRVAAGEVVRIVGLATDASFNVTSTLYVDYRTYEAARRAQNPDATAVPPSAIAVTVDRGRSPAAVAAAINRTVSGVEALDRETAAEAVPGVESINQSLSLIVLLSYAVILIVTGFFFLILTVQKARSLTLLRALGAPAANLVVAVLAQATLVVTVGFAAGTALSALALTAPAFLGATLEPRQLALTLAILLALGAAASLGAVRRVLRIEPVEATALYGAIQ